VNAGQMIDAVLEEGGFDSSTAAASRESVLGWLNDRLRTLVSESGWVKTLVEIGPTVAGTHQYAVPENVTDIRSILVGGETYTRVGPDQMFAARASGAYVIGAYGAFSPAYNAAGTPVLEIWPTPEESGQTISALATTSPAALTVETDVPSVPEDMHQALVDGAIATGLRRIYERHEDAERFEQAFSSPGSGQGAVQKLKRRANSLVGSGPIRARIIR
jgi:hypothetical protein